MYLLSVRAEDTLENPYLGGLVFLKSFILFLFDRGAAISDIAAHVGQEVGCKQKRNRYIFHDVVWLWMPTNNEQIF